MKRSASPFLIIIGAAILVVLIGGLYYRYLGAGGDTKSSHARPYGLPQPGQPFPTPPPGGSGRNAITGEPLSASQEPPPIGSAAGASLPRQGAAFGTSSHGTNPPSSGR